MALRVLNNPLLKHKLNIVRQKQTPPDKLRTLLEEIALMSMPLIFEDIPIRVERIETPTGVGDFEFVEEEDFVFVCILRAGLPLLNGALQALPGAGVGFLAIKRKEQNLEAELFYKRLPSLEGKCVVLLDPMLATGGTLNLALSELKPLKPKRLISLNLVASPEGVERIISEHPDVDLFILNIDEGLNPAGYIVPGVGDIGDRLFTEGL
ncbi:uracil phosphoribosyltransferase [Hydrogenobacter sp. T-2]|uniref:uracil phosphoribosyltransferase n=1 Tax=Pampinifervens diazotrophicum TaxID=1632018 RepID=UPI002B25CD32|nr:uracil phosphoribosyltransferase [Hydrogenobacter sp. T-2]WPM32022.1 uracil phosphoribosyltransferase [Hydrogenobacter sp. T-2]